MILFGAEENVKNVGYDPLFKCSMYKRKKKKNNDKNHESNGNDSKAANQGSDYLTILVLLT